jgi:hydrogenase maturation protein HypF
MQACGRPEQPGTALHRRNIQIRGQVQGVGFRPFVYRLARQFNLSGWVRNTSAGVTLEIQGQADALNAMLAALQQDLPPQASVTGMEIATIATRPEQGFVILDSEAGMMTARIAPDTAICPDCLAELFGDNDRRQLYPFINCMHCGPRYTIAARLPYDRQNTVMAKFPFCLSCLQEYQDPANRRFHAEATACPECGPTLKLRDASGASLTTDDPIALAAKRLQAGEILALKGLGGFHLLCDARNPAAVKRLRERKARDEKPFALMLLNVASLDGLARYSEAERAVLESVQRPIVLLERTGDELPGVADGLHELGVMLPYTPLHYLLFHALAGKPQGSEWLTQVHPWALVCTSANPGGEPLVRENAEALERLRGLADVMLLHDREILHRADDSVLRMIDGAPAFLRRSRGYTPVPVQLPIAGASILAVGGYFKNTICLTRGNEAFLSPHIGALDNAVTCEFLEESVAHLSQVLEIVPEAVVHDAHPDFFSSRFAAEFAAQHNIPAFAVQHHHVHIAAVAAEHGLNEPVLGLALDGVGLGSDGAPWGGELLRVDGAHFERLGYLRPLPLAGGDAAARQPWRMGAAVLHALGRSDQITQRFPYPAAEVVASLLARDSGLPRTSSCGRLFDAAAALLGAKQINDFEGQAAMRLESLAAEHGNTEPLPGGFVINPEGQLDCLPLLDCLADYHDAASGAALFHATLAAGLADWVQQASQRTGLRKVALGGGCFLNRILSENLAESLRAAGLMVFQARQAPANDGGLALGQAWIGLNLMKG